MNYSMLYNLKDAKNKKFDFIELLLCIVYSHTI